MGNGSIFVTEANGLTDLNLNAGTGNVTLTVAAGGIAELSTVASMGSPNLLLCGEATLGGSRERETSFEQVHS